MTAFLSMINRQFIFARLAAIALFAGLFILSACGGAPLAVLNLTVTEPNRPDAPDGPCAADVFSADCGLLGEPARTIALNTCRNKVQTNPVDTCESNIPAAAVACFKDPFDANCKTEEYKAVLARSSATPQIDMLRITRTTDCRVDTLTGDACTRAIANTCDPAAAASIATGTGDIRALLITDALCNDVPEYNDERVAFLNDCRDADESKKAGCTDTITACAYAPSSNANPFDAACIDNEIYDIDRIVYCQVTMADDDLTPPAGCEVSGTNIVDTYCKANIFTQTAKCSTNPAYAKNRIEDCIIGTNANLKRCQNRETFPALVACFENPFGALCGAMLGADLMTAQDNRTTYCRAVEAGDLAGDALCTGAVVNFCTISEFDELCVADIYIEQRETTCRTTPSTTGCLDIIAGLCADVFTQTLGDAPANLCVDAGASTTYTDARLAACLANADADESCKDTGGLIDAFCTDNPFDGADDCTVEAYEDDRETTCLKNPAFTDSSGMARCDGIISVLCSDDPLTQTMGDSPTDLCGGAYDIPRETACRKIDVTAVGTTVGCVALVTKTCTFVVADGSGTPYDPLCDEMVYGSDRTAFCMANTGSSRCDATIRGMCNTNPFSTDNGGMAICDESYAPDRLTRCRKDAAGTQDLPAGADCTDIAMEACNKNPFDGLCEASDVEMLCRQNNKEPRCRDTIIRVCGGADSVPAAPFDELCDDNDTYTEARELACIGVASGNATPDTADVDRCPDLIADFCMDNPFNAVNGYCRDENYNTDREAMCSGPNGAFFGKRECVGTITRICDVGNEIFNSVCDTGYTQARINDCISESPSDSTACDTAEVYGAICGGDTTNDNTNPFSTLCDMATPASGVTLMTLAMARQTIVTFCNDTISNGGRNPTRAVCMTAQDTITNLNRDCVLVANTFGLRCDYDEYDDERAAFCGVDGGANSFNDGCAREYATESEAGRKAFVALCSETPTTAGCATTAITQGVTVADCVTNPYRPECEFHPDIADEKIARTALCADSATFFSPLCNGEIITGVAANRLALCTTNVGSFNSACDTDYASEAMIKRNQLIMQCRETRDAEGCDTTAIDGSVYDSETSVTIADCITNPYRVECYGTDNDRNPYFVDETMARDMLCSDPTTFFNPLCDDEVVIGVRVARFARCTTEATTFDTNCTDAKYSGTDRVRAQLIVKCSAVEADDPPLQVCSQVVATGMDGNNAFTRTVVDCVDKGGDPYQSGCFENPLFNDERTVRMEFCGIGSNAGNDSKCTNATTRDLCINDPFGMDGMGATCSATTYGDAQTARTTYCSENAVEEADPLCATRKDFICVGTPMAESVPAVLAHNPFAQLCGDPGVVTPEQTAFCMNVTNLANNDNCAPNDPTGQGLVCPSNPFNDSFGLNDIDCTGAAYLAERVTLCFDGTQTDATECDKTGIADVICRATGAEANPFLAFCDGAQMAGFDGTTTLDGVRTAFANTCASDDVGVLICANAKSTLCLATGDFARPFAMICEGEMGLVDIQTDYCKTPATSFHANCNEAEYRGTDFAQRAFAEVCERDRTAAGCDAMTTGSVPIRDCVNHAMGNPYATGCVGLTGFEQQRIARALDCAEGRGTDCDSPVSGDVATTVAGCNTDPFAVGCDGVIFANARHKHCATATPKPAGCSVADGQGYTNYVRGSLTELDLGDSVHKDADELATYMEDNPDTETIDESVVYVEDDLMTTDIDESAVYVEDDRTTPDINESHARDDMGVRIPDNDMTPIDESRVRVLNDPTTPIDESRARVFDNPTTVLDESRIKIGSTYDAAAKVRRKGIEQGGLTLSAIGGSGDNLTDSGFAYAYIPGGRGADGIEGWDRYYAGLLSGTDVGAPLVDNTTDGAWHGRLAIVNGYGGEVRANTADFVLTVDFANKTLDAVDVAVLDGLFNIDGRFTTGGVIYGLTSFRDRTPSGSKELIVGINRFSNPITRETKARLASHGSVTGVIGVDGAVGAFISSGEGLVENTFGEYAGGFVASPTAPNPADSCLHSSNLLRADCIADDARYYDICVTTAEINSASTTEFCKPFVARYIERETECGDQVANLNTLTKPLCAPVFTQLCSFVSGNIFNIDAGTGGTKFDCTTVTQYDATRTRICSTPAYINGAVVELDGVVSTTDGLSVACVAVMEEICRDDPFTQTIAQQPTNLCAGDSYDTARETTCAQDIIAVVSAGAGVAPDTVSAANVAPSRCFDTIRTACRDNPFNADLCYSESSNFLDARVSACVTTPSVNAADCPTILSTNCPTDGGSRNRECISDGYRAWEAKFNTVDTPIEASIPDGETQNSRILLGGLRGLDTKTNVNRLLIPETFLRFNSRYTGIDTGETVTKSGRTIYDFIENDGYYHGVSFFSAETSAGRIGYYAGILSGTQVGAPLTDPRVAAQWHGQIGFVASDSNVPRQKYFTLNVNFSTRTISANDIPFAKIVSLDYPTVLTETIILSSRPPPDNVLRINFLRSSEVRDYVINDRFSLTATWDAGTGVFTGTTKFTTVSLVAPILPLPTSVPAFITLDKIVSTGVVTGIIGVDSAVGVFTSDETQADEDAIHYAGGFFARPAPRRKFNAWVGSFDGTGRTNAAGDALLEAGDFTRTARATGTTYFIEGLADGLGLATGGDYVVNNQGDSAEVILRLDNTDGEFGYSGVAFWSGTIRNDATDTGESDAFPIHSYGGLLSDTDVGAFLPRGGQATPNGVLKLVWTGQISGIFNGIDAQGMIGGTAVDTSMASVTRDGKLLTNTDFILTIDYTAGTIATLTDQSPFLDLHFDGSFDANGVISGNVTGVSGHGNGRFNGLIGVDGLVGVFKSNVGAMASFIGGFTATPPVRGDVAAWAASFGETGRANTASDVLLEAGIFTKTGRLADSSHFIEAGENGLGLLFDGVSSVHNFYDVPEYFVRLDGATGQIRAISPRSGAVFWAGFVRDNAQDNAPIAQLYAGLIPGTQVGLPLPQGAGVTYNGAPTATWNGTISGIFLGNGIATDIVEGAGLTRYNDRLTDTNFQLLVNYGTGALTTPVGKESFGGLKLSLDGTFDGGIMAGDVALAPTVSALMGRSAGRFSGVIGSGGAVGVFKSKDDATEGNNGYIGGFVATPPTLIRDIKTTDWVASFDQASSDANTIGANTAGDVLLKENIFTKDGRPADSSHFIKTGADGIGLFVNGVPSVHSLYNNVPERFLRLDGTTGTTGDASGAAFWAGNVRNNVGEVNESDTRVHLYAGLLSGTQVGLPLPQGAGATFQDVPSATWTGTIRGIFPGVDNIGETSIDGFTKTGDDLTDRNFQMLVDYGARTIKTPVGKESFGNLKLSLDGTFDGGVMAGAVALAPIGSAPARPAGRFNGLIGVGGAVGVFKSNDDDIANNGYIGGFMASFLPPPSPVRFSNWTDSFNATTRMNTVGDVLLAEDDITTTDRGTNTAYFITGNANGLGFVTGPGQYHNLNTNNASSRFLRLDGTTEATGDSSGIAFWGNVLGGQVHLYAGLLSGTNVGLTLPRGAGATFQGDSSATWTGTIRGLFQGTGATDFNQASITGFTKNSDVLMDTNFELLVNYGTGALTTPAGKKSFGTVQFGLDGNFDRNGVMTGDYTAEASRPNGRFSGIIGTTGAVGVFKSTGTAAANRIVGGFVAKPPTN